MKRTLATLIVLGFFTLSFAQQLPNLPIPLGAGNAEVWNGSIYHFGGSNNWSGSIVYPRVYRFNGTGWAYHDTIPDNNLWDVETLLVGDYVYLLGGWPNGPSLNRRYNLNTGNWVYLSQSPNLYQDWGLTSEELNSIIYLFNSYGSVFAYNIAADSWTTKTANAATGTWDLSSILFQGEIYILGWNNSDFYKYSPSTDTWMQLADSPYQVGACAFGIINNLIYAIGGNEGGATTADYKSIIVYDINTDTWVIDPMEISSKRHWMATAEYLGGLYVVGGIDELSLAVDIVEEIVPQGTAGIGERLIQKNGYSLEQNSPNPFSSTTRISYSLPVDSHATLMIFDVLGNRITTLVDEVKAAGKHETDFNLKDLHSGIYFYRLQSGNFSETKKLTVY
jgi:hypothetical protein